MQIDDFVKEIIRKYKELREKLSQVDPFTGCKIFLQQFFPGRYFRTFTIAVKLILSLGFLVSALFLSSTYLTFRVRLETDQPGQTEVRMSDKTDFRKSLHVREMVSVGESIVSFPVRKKKHYLYYPLLRKDATLKLKEMQVSAGIFRAVFSARDLSGLKKQTCRISEDGTLVAATADPIIFLDWKQIRERFQLHFSSSVVLFLIFCAATVALIWWFNLDRCGRIVERYPWLLSRPFGYCLWGVLFILLTLAGITGSPLGLHRNFNISSLHNERLLFGKYQMIRSNDYIAHGSGSAIINYKHSPAFPVKNTNIGISGRNMLFLHDWGAPVKHPAVLLKPATWGFFFMDLRRALAFYWLLPIFLGTFSVWLLLNTLFPNTKNIWNFLAALGVAFAPYSTVWSYWPMNCSTGSLLFAALLLLALRKYPQSKWKASLLALGSGYSLAFSGATLYFPHLYPVMLLCFLILGYKVIEERLWKAGKWIFAGLILLSLLTAVGCLAGYLASIREELAIALNSAYPGKRLLTGGAQTVWEVFKYNFMFFNYVAPQAGSVCDAQRYQLLFPLLFVIFIWKWKALEYGKLGILLLVYIAGIVYFQVVGIPPILAKITLFDRILEQRASYGIVIAQMILLVSLLNLHREEGSTARKTKSLSQRFYSFLVPALVALVYTAICTGMFMKSFEFLPVITHSSKIRTAFILDIVFIFTYSIFLLWKPRFGLFLFVVVIVGRSLCFNSISIAPTDVTSPLQEYVAKAPGKKFDGRVLFINPWNSDDAGSQTGYAMAGGKSYTGFFCYEDLDIYEKLMAHLPKPEQYHRLNHLSTWLTDVPHCPQMNAMVMQKDVIRLYFHAENYDFSTLPVDFLFIPDAHYVKQLSRNSSIKKEMSFGFWQLYRVCREEEKKTKRKSL